MTKPRKQNVKEISFIDLR